MVIAIEDYAFLPDVPGAFRNGQDWYNYLVRTRGVPADRVRFIANAEATDFAITKAMDEIAALARPGAKTWVVFVGHGAPKQDASDGLLVPADAQQTSAGIENRSVAQADVLRRLAKGVGTPVLIVDACYSGKRPDGEVLVAGLQPSAPVVAAPPAEGGLVLTAAASDQFAGPLPGAQRPAFSYLMLGALRGWADENGDGQVTAGEAIGYTRSTLQAVLSGSRDQTPGLAGDGTLLLAKSYETPPDLAALVLGTKLQLGPESATEARPPSMPLRAGRVRVAASCGGAKEITLPDSGLRVEDITEPTPVELKPLGLTSRYDPIAKHHVYDPVGFDVPVGARVIRIAAPSCATAEVPVQIVAGSEKVVVADLETDPWYNGRTTGAPKGWQAQLLGTMLVDTDSSSGFPGVSATGAWVQRWFMIDGALSFNKGSAIVYYEERSDIYDPSNPSGLQTFEVPSDLTILAADASFMGRLPLGAVALYTGVGGGVRSVSHSGDAEVLNYTDPTLSWTFGFDVKVSCDWGITARSNLNNAGSDAHPLLRLGLGATWQPNDCRTAEGKAKVAGNGAR